MIPLYSGIGPPGPLISRLSTQIRFITAPGKVQVEKSLIPTAFVKLKFSEKFANSKIAPYNPSIDWSQYLYEGSFLRVDITAAVASNKVQDNIQYSSYTSTSCTIRTSHCKKILV